jgi:hypothetical protein
MKHVPWTHLDNDLHSSMLLQPSDASFGGDHLRGRSKDQARAWINLEMIRILVCSFSLQVHSLEEITCTKMRLLLQM